MLPKWVVRTIIAAVLTEIIRLVFHLIRTWQPLTVPGNLRAGTATEEPPARELESPEKVHVKRWVSHLRETRLLAYNGSTKAEEHIRHA
jgi:hypothetical protein